ncbi:MAG: NAD(P)-dependent oxidoreductase, partial [Betaproteobacteria bacterium]|nr:NAD(P)-dependent oxidoreductase [Betaproteobacteria bacterium]
KLIHGLINAATLVGIAEALVVGRKSGIDPQMMFDIISVSRGNSGIFQSRAPRMLDGNFSAAFAIDLKYKDMTLALNLAQDLKIPVVVAEAARAVFQMARAKGLGGSDIAAVVTVLEEWAGVTVRRRK